MAHTPAPWKIDFVEHLGCTSYMLNETQGGEFGEEAEANARLIEAAPDLLAAAAQAWNLLDSVAFVSEPGDHDAVLAVLKAAIDKAKNGSEDDDCTEPDPEPALWYEV
jgi:hypothetical protein